MTTHEEGAPVDSAPSVTSLDGADLETQHLARVVRRRLFTGLQDETSVGRYTLLERIGQGGMGVVYRAHDRQLGRLVALKLQHARGDGSGELGRLMHEAQALARLAHPNVVPVFEVGEDGGRVYMVMEYIAGVTLRSWLGERRRSWLEVLKVLVQAGRGLAAAHAHGIVHRDVKPDNVMIGADSRARIVDFGLAHAADADGSPPAALEFVGTPEYMAPEQFLRELVDARSDQYSFCKVAWEALHGESPHAGVGLVALRDEVVAGRLRAPPGKLVPRHVDTALRRGMQRQPDARHPSMAALLTALEQVSTRRRSWAAAVPVLLAAGYMAFNLYVRRDMSLETESAVPVAAVEPRPWLAAAGPRGACAAVRARVGVGGGREYRYTRTVSPPITDMQASFYNVRADEVVLLSFRGEGVRVTRDGAVLGRVSAPSTVAPILDGAAYDPRRGTALLVDQECMSAEVDPLTFTVRSFGPLYPTRTSKKFCGGLGIDGNGELRVAETERREQIVLAAGTRTEQRRMAVPLAHFDGFTQIAASGEWLAIDHGGLAMILDGDGDVVVAQGTIGVAPPLVGGGPISIPDAVHVVCKTGEVWVCEGLDGGKECRIFAPTTGEIDACACL